MADITEAIENLFKKKFGGRISEIDKLPQSGSDREYFRIHCEGTSFQSCIATANSNVRENETFIYFSQNFRLSGCNVPEVYAINDEKTLYLQEDVGDVCLLDVLEKEGENEKVLSLYKKSLHELAKLQIAGGKNIDFTRCITSNEFGKAAILSDLLYFKYYFLDTLKFPYDKEQLIKEFETFSSFLADTGHKHFMFRDFQGRNIMVKNDDVFFIDYQGGMKGALQYDVASLLWQAKANLSDEWKSLLLHYYIDCVEQQLSSSIDKTSFKDQYNGYVLIRLLQVLGAYGFRGLFEKKAHFLSSIPLALQNLRNFTAIFNAPNNLGEFSRVLQFITGEEVKEMFSIKKATADSPLVININSFSYLQRGYPPDPSKHGGGFVFDCRGILNPGRIDAYKSQTGRDKEVIRYIEQKTKMQDFLNGVFSVVDIAVEDYLERNFDCLTVNFGCTGGRHRSVYAADALARHLRNKYAVKMKVHHMEQNIYEEKL